MPGWLNRAWRTYWLCLPFVLVASLGLPLVAVIAPAHAHGVIGEIQLLCHLS